MIYPVFTTFIILFKVLAIEQPRFITINGETIEESREEPIPEPFKSSLLKPFKVSIWSISDRNWNPNLLHYK